MSRQSRMFSIAVTQDYLGRLPFFLTLLYMLHKVSATCATAVKHGACIANN